MKFIVIGISELAIYCAQALLDSGAEICALISMPEKSRPNNPADFSSFVAKNNITYHELENINSSEGIKLLREYKPDYIFGALNEILTNEVLEIPNRYCIGAHPTDLPFNRGRHPLHWLISMGITESKLSFFIVDEGIDTGNILIQIPFKISSSDAINDAVNNMNKSAYAGMKKVCNKLLSDPSYRGYKQDNSRANYWRKRTPHDVTLDLRMPADLITRIVRSFTIPYPCANLIYKKNIIKIKKAKIVTTNVRVEELQRIEPGRIISADEKTMIVKVDDEIIELVCLDQIPEELLSAKYIHPPSKYVNECNIRFD